MLPPKKGVEKLGGLVAEIGRALQSIPERFSFANAQGGFPPEVIMSRDSRSANGHDWPSADKINETLAKMHSAKTEMNNAWQRSSPIERDALQPPPGIAKRY